MAAEQGGRWRGRRKEGKGSTDDKLPRKMVDGKGCGEGVKRRKNEKKKGGRKGRERGRMVKVGGTKRVGKERWRKGKEEGGGAEEAGRWREKGKREKDGKERGKWLKGITDDWMEKESGGGKNQRVERMRMKMREDWKGKEVEGKGKKIADGRSNDWLEKERRKKGKEEGEGAENGI